MEIREMKVEDIEARKQEIVDSLESIDNEEELRSLNDEMDQLNAEIESRAKLQAQKEEVRTKVANGEGTTIIENIVKEERRMEFKQNSPEYRDAWVKTIMRQNLNDEERNIMEEARAFSSSNTYAVPTIISDRVLEILRKKAPLINEIELFEVAGNLRIPVESVVSDAYEHTENATITASSDALVYIDLEGKEIVKITEVSKNALAQSAPAFENWLVNELARKLADKIDDLIVTALGSGTFTTDTNQIVDTNGLSYDGLCNLIKLTPAHFDNGAKFFVNKATLWEIRKIKDNEKRPIFDPVSNILLGYPVIVDDYISKTNSLVYFGNAFEFIKGKVDPNVQVEGNEYGAGWDKALVSYRGYTTFDVKKAGTVGIVRFVTTA